MASHLHKHGFSVMLTSSNAVQVVDECTAAHEKLDFLQAGRVAYDFFWNQFADWYVEASKTRLYGQDPERAAAARQVSS